MHAWERRALGLLVSLFTFWLVWSVSPGLIQATLGPHCDLGPHWELVTLTRPGLIPSPPCPASPSDLLGALVLATLAGVLAGVVTTRLADRRRG